MHLLIPSTNKIHERRQNATPFVYFFFLHPHGEQAQEHTRQLSQPRAGFPTADSDAAGLGDDRIHVLLQATAGIFAVEDRAALIVELEAAVIHVDGTHHGNLAVCNKGLGMEKAGLEPIDLHAVGEKHLVVGTGHNVGVLMIRDAGEQVIWMAPSSTHRAWMAGPQEA